MPDALIGYTGFVGSNLLGARPFDHLFNTANMGEIEGKSFDLIVSAAARADSHRINLHGEDDRAEIDAFIDTLSTAEAKKLVLISTVCVYPGDSSPDESAELSEAGLTPYGANRLHMERRLAERFDTLIVRLPQLYGDNLKKGVVYDLLNDYRVEFIRPETRFQHYDIRRLWEDIERALALGLDSINIATPPISNAELAREVFDRDISSARIETPESPFAQMYTRDMRTRHAEHWSGADGYLESRDREIDALRRFVGDG